MLHSGLRYLTLEQAKRLQGIRQKKGTDMSTRSEKNKAGYVKLIDDLVKSMKQQSDK